MSKVVFRSKRGQPVSARDCGIRYYSAHPRESGDGAELSDLWAAADHLGFAHDDPVVLLHIVGERFIGDQARVQAPELVLGRKGGRTPPIHALRGIPALVLQLGQLLAVFVAGEQPVWRRLHPSLVPYEALTDDVKE